jgi:sigma-E factor negative regulatory protein RseA
MSERLSAMVDDELPSDDAVRLIESVPDDPELAERWATYHLIGDALRGTQPAAMDMKRFAARMAAEPAIVAPRPIPLRPAAPNRARTRTALSIAAGVAAVAFVGWVAAPSVFQGSQPLPAVVTAPAAPEQGVALAGRPAVIPAAHGVENYLLAHQRFSPTFAIQGAVPYVRMVSEEQRGRAQ